MIKTDLGKVAKIILDKINSNIRKNTSLLQWSNSLELITWFEKLPNKNNLNFLKFDICSFYPSISKNELVKALDFAKNYSKINQEDERIIFHSCISILSDLDGNTWTKADNNSFDVPMGSYMGAEICDLVGLYLLNDLGKIAEANGIGLYRDDGLMITNKSKCHQESIGKKTKICI